MLLRESCIVDVTIIAVPNVIANREKFRAPEMRQTKKGNEWHFGMKMHIDADDVLRVAAPAWQQRDHLDAPGLSSWMWRVSPLK